MKRWGALPKEWDLFVNLGLTEDLIPVVCNPKAKIDPKSKMKRVGKTPSVYNASGFVAGFGKWTEKKSDAKQISRWKAQEDYGVCIQTRFVRALDIDVPDQAKADKIKHFVEKKLAKWDVVTPVRYRKDSGKCLLAFIVQGEFEKRTVRVKGGIIEFLANGQQFVAAGQHQDGERYKWDWQGSEEFPVVSMKKVDKLWTMIVEKFAIDDEERQRALNKDGYSKRNKKTENVLIVPDDTMNYLEENGRVLSYGQEGQAFIDCPFKDQHTSESVESATAYFPKGTRGYAQGHFKCLHAHCADKTNMDFLDALGVTDSYFEEIVLSPEEIEKKLPSFSRDRFGKIEAIIDNLDKALRSANVAGVRIGFDEFLGEEMIQRVDKNGKVTAWRPLVDTDYTKIQIRLEQGGFKPIGIELLRRAVKNVAQEQCFDSAIAWIDNLPKWDGVKRVERFLPDYIGTKDDDYHRAVGVYIWTALAGRVLHPGIKADMTPIFYGAQGAGKSTIIEMMAAMPNTFGKISFDDKDDDFSRKIRGLTVAEIDELRGLNNRDSEYIKSAIARTHEKFIKKYEEKVTVFPRRCLFLASTNIRQLLADDTGERRWLPFECATHGIIDRDKFGKDVLQFWAEGAAMFKTEGVAWHGAERLAQGQHEKYKVTDARIELIRDWLEEDSLDGDRPADRQFIMTHDVLINALGFRAKEIQRKDEMAVSSMMIKLGYEKKRKRLDGVLKWVFVQNIANSKEEKCDLA